MNHRTVFIAWMIIASLCGCAGGKPAVTPLSFGEDRSGNDFPLVEGAYWVYEGALRWVVGDEVHAQDIRWQMAVIEFAQCGEVSGYHMQGHPGDLAWYEPGKAPSEYTIIRTGHTAGRLYYADLEAFQRLKACQDALVDLVQDTNLFLEIPLQPGQRFCEAQQITRTDGMYCWVVSSGSQSELKNVPGVNQASEFVEYSIAKYTMPDHTIVQFAPGIGITGFVYNHHGTVSEVEVRLAEYHPGK